MSVTLTLKSSLKFSVSQRDREVAGRDGSKRWTLMMVREFLSVAGGRGEGQRTSSVPEALGVSSHKRREGAVLCTEPV